MRSVGNRILARMRARGARKWVGTPKDFLDLGTRGAVDQALSRLVKTGKIRRVAHGLYDLPRWGKLVQRTVPPELSAVVAALVRRDNVRIIPNGMAAANYLRLTTAVSIKPNYLTNGAPRSFKVGGWTIKFLPAQPALKPWFGRPGEVVVNALCWLGPHWAESDEATRVLPRLSRRLPDDVKRDLTQGLEEGIVLPGWMMPAMIPLTSRHEMRVKPRAETTLLPPAVERLGESNA